MVAQRTLTPYVRVRILLPLPKEEAGNVKFSASFLLFARFFARKSSTCKYAKSVLPLSLPQLDFLPLNPEKESAPSIMRSTELFSCLFEIFKIALHPGSAVLFHAFRNMAVHVERKSGGRMAEIFLHGLYIVTVL